MSGAGGRGITARPALPLALTLAVHLLLVLAWLHSRPQRADGDKAPLVVSFLLPVPVPVPKAVPAPAVARATRATPARAGAPAASPPPLSTPSDQPVTVADPAPAGPSAADILARAKRDVGPIERELRGGKSGVPLLADTPWARFRRGLEGAYVDRSHTATMDSYTSADGTVIYRMRVGGKVICRATGDVGPPGVERSAGAVLAGAGSAGGGGMAGTVNCPSGDVHWERR